MRCCLTLSLFVVILAATGVTHSQPTIKLTNDDFSDDYCTQDNEELSVLAAEVQSIKRMLSTVDGKT